MTNPTGRHGVDGEATPSAPADGALSASNTTQAQQPSPVGMQGPKNVTFRLVGFELPQSKARLPMRLNIFPHDTTEGIVTTVKNFYGLYNVSGHSKAISFQDQDGLSHAASYETLEDGALVYARVVDDLAHGPGSYGASSRSRPLAPADGRHCFDYPGHPVLPQPAQALDYGDAHANRLNLNDQQTRGRQGALPGSGPVKMTRSRSGYKSRASSTHGRFPDINSDGMTGYSSGDGTADSAVSRTKSEHLGNMEISLDNIVEGGRRKRAKFESSVGPASATSILSAISRALLTHFKGTSSLCTTSDAGRYLELLGLPSPAVGSSSDQQLLFALWSTPICKCTHDAVAAVVRRDLWPGL
jgi:hypothetical protein